jgi:hypothetical protein
VKTRLSNEFKKGFLVSEEHLVKIADIIGKRANERNVVASLHYKAFRSDGVTYETESYTGILSQENSKRYAVTALKISCKNDTLEFDIKFDAAQGSSIAIESADRDFAFLLFSDIKDYFAAEILTSRSFSFDRILSNKATLSIVMLLVFSFTFFPMLHSPVVDATALNKVIAGTDLNAKMNFILRNDRGFADTRQYAWSIPALLIVMLLTTVGGSALDRLFPRNIFYWGKMIESQNKRKDLQSKITWGGVIAFVITVIGTIVVDFMKTGGL